MMDLKRPTSPERIVEALSEDVGNGSGDVNISRARFDSYLRRAASLGIEQGATGARAEAQTSIERYSRWRRLTMRSGAVSLLMIFAVTLALGAEFAERTCSGWTRHWRTAEAGIAQLPAALLCPGGFFALAMLYAAAATAVIAATAGGLSYSVWRLWTAGGATEARPTQPGAALQSPSLLKWGLVGSAVGFVALFVSNYAEPRSMEHLVSMIGKAAVGGVLFGLLVRWLAGVWFKRSGRWPIV